MTFNILIPYTPVSSANNDSDMYQYINGLINSPVPEGLGYTDCTVIDIVAIYFSPYNNSVFALCTLETSS